jgi:P-type E1-E2 ATPase
MERCPVIETVIPGWGALELGHLVLDLNGSVALDGELIPGVEDQVAALSAHLAVHLVTADTQGQAEGTSRRLGCQLVRI